MMCTHPVIPWPGEGVKNVDEGILCAIIWKPKEDSFINNIIFKGDEHSREESHPCPWAIAR